MGASYPDCHAGSKLQARFLHRATKTDDNV